METEIQFQNIKTREEFFFIFQGICNVAENAFNQFEEEFKNINKDGLPKILGYCKNLSYLMSITFVIMGMRGDYSKFRADENIYPFFVEKDDVMYDQKYLYKMNDYFAERFKNALSILENIDPVSAEPYKKVWTIY